jgi:hypothetical protein
MFATGTYWTVLAGPEFKSAISEGIVSEVAEVYCYAMERFLTDFVDYFWGLRRKYQQEGNGPYEQLCKIALNSLYGKFGQRDWSWERVDGVTPPRRWCKWARIETASGTVKRMRSLGNLVQQKADTGPSKYSFIALPAFVTSYAREHMRRLRDIAGEANIWYQACDSLHLNETGYQRLVAAGCIDSEALGAMKLVGIYETAEYRGINDYTLDGSDKIAGLRKSARKVGSNEWEQVVFDGLASIYSRLPSDSVGSRVERVHRCKQFPPGRIYSDGRVSPPHLEMPGKREK